VLYTDGGGKRKAALRPILGKDRIVRFYEGVRTKFGGNAFTAHRVEETTLNGLPGFVFHTAEGTETVAFEIANGMVVAIYNVRNPDKVKHLE
jgi:RNA polymerase sigma-70 factor (ECF subfamily)